MINMFTALVVFCVCIAYLLGSLNTAIIISRLFGKRDIRDYGSKNAGATNTLRVMGKGAALCVVIFDALKGVAAVLFARLAPSIFAVDDINHTAEYLAALAVVAGHVFPVYFGFKGGKGIMTSIAVIFVLDWEIGIILLVTCVVIMVLTKYVSLGSCIGAIMFPMLVYMFHEDNGLFIAVSLIMAFTALFMHRTNIVRLVHGTESKLSFKK